MNFRILSESKDIIAPSNGGPTNERLKYLVRDTEFYLDTERSEIFAYVPGGTSLLRGMSRTENLYFHYTPAHSDDLVGDFCDILESLNDGEPLDSQKRTSSGSQEATGVGPIPDEIYEHEWEIRRKRPDGDLWWPWLIRKAEPELPNISFLQREVFDQLIKEQQKMDLGMRTQETAASVIKYVATSGYKTSVGIPKSESLTRARTTLSTGSDKDFEPKDDSTSEMLRTTLEDHLENYASNQVENIKSKLDELEDITQGDEALYRELKKVERYIDAGVSPNYRASKTRKIIETFDRARSSKDVPEETTDEIEQEVRRLIEERLDTIQERILREDLRELKSLIDETDQLGFKHDPARLKALVEIDNTLHSESPDQVTKIQRATQYRPIREFAEVYAEILEYDSDFKSLVEEITSRAKDHLDPKIRSAQNGVKRTIIDKTKEDISVISNNRVVDKDGKVEVFAELHEGTKQALEKKVSPDVNSDLEAAQDISTRISRILESEGLTKDAKEDILNTIATKLEQKKEAIRKKRKQELERKVTNISGRIKGPGLSIEQSLSRVKEREDIINAYPENYNSAKTNATVDIGPIDEIIETPCLEKREKDTLLNEARQELDLIRTNLNNEVRNKKKDELKRNIYDIDNEFPASFPEAKRNELEVAREVIKNPNMKKLDSDNSAAPTRRLESTVDEIYNDHELSKEDKEHIFETAKTEIDELLGQLSDVSKSGNVKVSQEKKAQSLPNNSPGLVQRVRNKLTNRKVLSVAIAGIILFGMLGAIAAMSLTGTLPDLMSQNGEGEPEISVSAPNQGDGVAASGLLVNGTTTAAAVNISAEHQASGEVYSKEVEVEENVFNATLTPTEPGQYLITVQPVTDSESPSVERYVTYLGTDNPEVSLSQPSMANTTNSSVVRVGGESTFDSVDIELYNSNGTILDRNTTEVQGGTFETEVTGDQDGVYILVATPTGVNGQEYRDVRAVRVGQEQQTGQN